MKLWDLFWSFLQVGLFSIGGGYAALPIIRDQIVEANGFLTMSEFADVVTIAEMTPGPIAINAATFVGTRVGGIAGALVATGGCVLPSLAIVLTLAYLYSRFGGQATVQGVLGGLRPAVVGLIASAGLSIIALAFWGGALTDFAFAKLNPIAIAMFAAALAVLLWKKPNPILVMALTGVAGLLVYGILGL